MFSLTIRTSGAAFTIESNGEDNGDAAPGPEIARILRKLADDIDGYGTAAGDMATVRDVNGHTVGVWRLTADDED